MAHGVSGGYVTQTEYLITKYAIESKLNKRNGNKLIALATRADFRVNPSEIRADSIRQIERWPVGGLLLQTIRTQYKNSIFCVHQMEIRNRPCISGTLLIVEDLVADV